MPQQQDMQHVQTVQAQTVSCSDKPSMEMQKLERMEYPPMGYCQTTMYVFGGLIILALLTQIILQAKTLKQLRKYNRKS